MLLHLSPMLHLMSMIFCYECSHISSTIEETTQMWNVEADERTDRNTINPDPLFCSNGRRVRICRRGSGRHLRPILSVTEATFAGLQGISPFHGPKPATSPLPLLLPLVSCAPRDQTRPRAALERSSSCTRGAEGGTSGTCSGEREGSKVPAVLETRAHSVVEIRCGGRREEQRSQEIQCTLKSARSGAARGQREHGGGRGGGEAETGAAARRVRVEKRARRTGRTEQRAKERGGGG